MMMSNQLTDDQRVHPEWLGLKRRRGYSVGSSGDEQNRFYAARKCGNGQLAGSPWRLVAGRSIDQSVSVFLAHNMADLLQMVKGIGLDVWTPIDEFQIAAMT